MAVLREKKIKMGGLTVFTIFVHVQKSSLAPHRGIHHNI